MAAQPGNQNASRQHRAFTEVLNRALLADNAKKLRKMADVLITKALQKQDLQAIREILDRTEGKPRQQVEHTGLDDGPIAIEYTQRERARRIAFLLAANDPEHTPAAAVPKRANGGNGA